ncbi:AAA family ATPase [Candidatus Micrarchaeota archaeon]|nr:AAA family ATPase [Candidatus Micrarchaeota archaeon]
MKGPNPFSPWEEAPGSIIGRKEETRIFNAFLNATSSKQTGMIVMTGTPGLGKSSLLRYFRQMAEKEGMLAPLVKVEKGENEEAVAEKLHHELAILPGFATRGKGAPSRLDELPDKTKLDKQHFGIVFFIDDIDLMKKNERAVKKLAETVRKHYGKKPFSFVVSSTREFRVRSELVQLIELEPFTEENAREMVEKALKEKKLKMGEGCLKTILADTNGNQKLFKSVCRYIYDRLRENEKVMTKGHYLAYLPYIMSMLSRESFGRMYQETPPAERSILHEIAKNEKGGHISDVAGEIGRPLGQVTALAKRLLDRGQIVRMERGKYRIFSRLYARYVLQRG